MPPIKQTLNTLTICDMFDPDVNFTVDQQQAGDLDRILSNRFARVLPDFIAKIYCFHMTGFLTLEEDWSEEDRKFYKSKRKHNFTLNTSRYEDISKMLHRIGL